MQNESLQQAETEQRFQTAGFYQRNTPDDDDALLKADIADVLANKADTLLDSLACDIEQHDEAGCSGVLDRLDDIKSQTDYATLEELHPDSTPAEIDSLDDFVTADSVYWTAEQAVRIGNTDLLAPLRKAYAKRCDPQVYLDERP